MSASCIMKHLLEKRVSSEISKCIWSPKMDLLALSNVQGQVALHRLYWQKVWVLSPPYENLRVTDMAWRPDGKVLAVGYSSGKVLLVNIEDSSVIHELSFIGEVTALSWKGYSAGEGEDISPPKEDPWVQYMYPLPPLNKNKESDGDQWQEPRLLQNQNALTVLTIGTVPSILHMYAFGLFHISTLDVNESMFTCTRILNIIPSPDLGMFSIILERRGDHSNNEVAQIALKTSLLSEYHQELCSLSQKYGQIYSLMTYIKHTISHIEEAHETNLLDMDVKLASYAGTVPEGSVTADFLDLLVFGYSSSEFEIFLTNKLTENWLKKLRQSVELSYSNMQKLVVNNLKAVGLTLVFLLSQVVGMARIKERYSILGVSEDTVVEAMREAGSFLLKAGEMLQVIDSTMEDYQNFLKWVSSIQLRFLREQVPTELSRFTQQDMYNIAKFLDESFEDTVVNSDGEQVTRFRMERVGQYLANEDLKFIHQADEIPWVEFLKQNPGFSDHPLIFSHHPNKSLIQEHHDLTVTLTKTGSQPVRAISDAIVIGPAISLVTLNSEIEPIISQICSANGQIMYISILTGYGEDRFYLIQKSLDDFCFEEGQKVNVSHFVTGTPFVFSPLGEIVSSSARMPIVDAQFYNEDILSVILRNTDASDVSSIFVQFRLSYFSKELPRLSLPTGLPFSEVGVPPRDASLTLDTGSWRRLESPAKAMAFVVSGKRKVAAILGDNKRIVSIYEMELEEEDEDDIDDTINTTNASGASDDHNDGL